LLEEKKREIIKLKADYAFKIKQKDEALEESRNIFEGHAKLYQGALSVIQSRDLQIIELEKINLEYFKSIHQNSIKILAQEEEIENLKKYSKGMRKLNKDMIKKYVALNNELELLTKTAPFGKGNK
jgi:hypothetical protein